MNFRLKIVFTSEDGTVYFNLFVNDMYKGGMGLSPAEFAEYARLLGAEVESK